MLYLKGLSGVALLHFTTGVVAVKIRKSDSEHSETTSESESEILPTLRRAALTGDTLMAEKCIDDKLEEGQAFFTQDVVTQARFLVPHNDLDQVVVIEKFQMDYDRPLSPFNLLSTVNRWPKSFGDMVIDTENGESTKF